MFVFNIYNIYKKSKFQISPGFPRLHAAAQQKGPPTSGPASLSLSIAPPADAIPSKPREAGSLRS